MLVREPHVRYPYRYHCECPTSNASKSFSPMRSCPASPPVCFMLWHEMHPWIVAVQALVPTYLGVGHTTVVPRLGERLVLAVAVAAGRSSSHLEYYSVEGRCSEVGVGRAMERSKGIEATGTDRRNTRSVACCCYECRGCGSLLGRICRCRG